MGVDNHRVERGSWTNKLHGGVREMHVSLAVFWLEDVVLHLHVFGSGNMRGWPTYA